MAAETDWKQEYKLFGDFIASYPEIVITTNEVSIPQKVREEFYRHFDGVRRAILEAYYSTLPAEVEMLSDNYLRIEKEITELLGVDRIIVPVDLFSFLHSPRDGLIRTFYNKLFDLLQGKVTVETFEKRAGDDLRAAAADLYRLGYELWAALVLIKLLDPDQAFLVDLEDDYKPILRELKDISFGRQAHHPTMRIPEFVLHSRKINTYVAVKMALAREIETFIVPIKPPVRPRKKTGDTSFALDSRVMILSFMPTRDEIPVIADIYDQTLTSPDLMIEYITGSELDNPSSLDQVKYHRDAMRPKLGMCLILIDADGKTGLEGVPENVRTVAAGFDQSQLQSIVDTLPVQS
jgi:hypothetical protein